MGYMKIPNLYKEQDVLLFKEVYAMEKIHGTSAHIRLEKIKPDNTIYLDFFSGGERHDRFAALFDDYNLVIQFEEMGIEKLIFYGEAYGGSQQGMSHTYGKELKFVVFDVKLDGMWLDVPNAEQVAKRFGLDFVWYVKTQCDTPALALLRDKPSQQAIKNGVGDNLKSEGIVIRPLIELTKNNGNRVMAKHKRDDFRETATPRKIIDPAKLQILSEANAVADEWVTEMRLTHVIDKFKADNNIENVYIDVTGTIVRMMISDIQIEGEGEIAWSKEVEKAIGKKTAQLFKKRVQIIN